MNAIDWWSQPFPPEGGQTAEGIKKQLGRPSLPEYAVLIREAVQNSWDARIGEQIDFSITLRRLGSDALAWRRWLGSETSSAASARSKIARLSSDSWLLTLSDRGTTGLGGPIRSDEIERPGQVANFVQFIRNVGEPRDRTLGGGTYGFGKGIFFRISTAGAILVDTRNSDGDQFSRRLMGSALGETELAADGRRLTGRHWWGQINAGIPDPVMGDRAAEISKELGLPGFSEDETGTDVTVILPNLELDDVGGDVDALGEILRSHIYWHLWPKMGSLERSPDIKFSVTVEGRELEFPHVDDLPVICDLAKSLDDVKQHRGTPYSLQKYSKEFGFLGHLSIHHTMPELVSGGVVWPSIALNSPIDPPYRHIARMRHTELVVDYFEGEPMPAAQIGYVGVFVASASADEFFAQAEPPTHDAWEIGTLTGSARGVVQRAQEFLKNQCRVQVEARTGARSKTVEGLGRLSHTLGTIVQGAPGTRPTPQGRSRGSHGSGGRGASPVFRLISDSTVVVEDGYPFIESVIEVGDHELGEAILSAEATVLLAGGRREKPEHAPKGAEESRVLGWFYRGNGPHHVAGECVGAPDLVPGTWAVRATYLPDVAVRLRITTEDPDG